MRSISAFWSFVTSRVNSNSAGSYAEPGCSVQRLDHLHGAFVVLDHELEEQAVEVRAVRGRERGHLLGRGHAFHAGRARVRGVIRGRRVRVVCAA